MAALTQLLVAALCSLSLWAGQAAERASTPVAPAGLYSAADLPHDAGLLDLDEEDQDTLRGRRRFRRLDLYLGGQASARPSARSRSVLSRAPKTSPPIRG